MDYHYIDFWVASLYTDLSSLVKFATLLPFLLFIMLSFSLCSRYWSLNKHTIRLVQLRIKSLVLDLVLIFYYLYCLQNRVRVEFIFNHLVRSVHSFILQMLIEVWCWELRDRGTWRGSSVIFTLTLNGRYAACGFVFSGALGSPLEEDV